MFALGKAGLKLAFTSLPCLAMLATSATLSLASLLKTLTAAARLKVEVEKLLYVRV